MKPFIKRATITTAAIAATLTVVGIGFAAYTTNGNGNVQATSAAPVPVTVAATTASNLYPGSSSPTSVTVKNPNTFPVTVSSIQQNGLTTDNQSALASPQCDASQVAFSKYATTFTIPAGGNATVTGTVTMASSASNECGGLTFTIPVTANSTNS